LARNPVEVFVRHHRVDHLAQRFCVSHITLGQADHYVLFLEDVAVGNRGENHFADRIHVRTGEGDGGDQRSGAHPGDHIEFGPATRFAPTPQDTRLEGPVTAASGEYQHAPLGPLGAGDFFCPQFLRLVHHRGQIQTRLVAGLGKCAQVHQ